MLIAIIIFGTLIVCLLGMITFFATFSFVAQQSIMQTLRDVSLMTRLIEDKLGFTERILINMNAIVTSELRMPPGEEGDPALDDDARPKKMFGTPDGKIIASNPQELIEKMMSDPEYKKLIDAGDVTKMKRLFEKATDKTVNLDEEEPPAPEKTDGIK